MTILEELTQYAKDCINDVIISGQKHKWACQRFLNDCEALGSSIFLYYWDEEEAQ